MVWTKTSDVLPPPGPSSATKAGLLQWRPLHRLSRERRRADDDPTYVCVSVCPTTLRKPHPRKYVMFYRPNWPMARQCSSPNEAVPVSILGLGAPSVRIVQQTRGNPTFLQQHWSQLADHLLRNPNNKCTWLTGGRMPEHVDGRSRLLVDDLSCSRPIAPSPPASPATRGLLRLLLLEPPSSVIPLAAVPRVRTISPRPAPRVPGSVPLYTLLRLKVQAASPAAIVTVTVTQPMQPKD